MNVRCITRKYPVSLIYGKIYEVIGIEMGMYRILDEDGVDEDAAVQGYLYSPEYFEVASET